MHSLYLKSLLNIVGEYCLFMIGVFVRVFWEDRLKAGWLAGSWLRGLLEEGRFTTAHMFLVSADMAPTCINLLEVQDESIR